MISKCKKILQYIVLHIVCDVGYEGGSCDPCGVGYYKSTKGNKTCTACGSKTTTAVTGSNNVGNCSKSILCTSVTGHISEFMLYKNYFKTE